MGLCKEVGVDEEREGGGEGGRGGGGRGGGGRGGGGEGGGGEGGRGEGGRGEGGEIRVVTLSGCKVGMANNKHVMNTATVSEQFR